jgi:aryl-alcohol dehydrogenase-like predicted oxidoreductase
MPSRMTNGATLEGIRQQLAESLERLGCGYVDLYYMHRVCTKVAIEDVARSMKLLQVPPRPTVFRLPVMQ